MDNFWEYILVLYIIFSLAYCIFYMFIFLLREDRYGFKYIFKMMSYIDIISLIIFFPALILLILVLSIIEFICAKPKIFSWLFKKPFKK